MKCFTLVVLSSCLTTLLLSGCQTPMVERAKPVVIPVLPAVDLKTDPASLIEGVYVGPIETRTPTRIGIIDVGTHLLVRRLNAHRIVINTTHGQMNTYEIELTTSGDTILSLPNQLIRLKVLMSRDQPVRLEAIGTSLIKQSEQQPDLDYFTSLEKPPFRPMANYRSIVSSQSSLHFLTGIYCGNFPIRVKDDRNYLYTSKPIVVKQVSTNEVDLFDVNLWEKPFHFSLQKQPNDSIWTGTANGMKVTFTIAGGRTQQLSIDPLVADTTNMYDWPPLNFRYDVKKPTYNSTYIQF